MKYLTVNGVSIEYSPDRGPVGPEAAKFAENVDAALDGIVDTGVTTMAAVGAVPNANGASISGVTLTLQPADGSNPGVVTAGAQTIAGAKTLSTSVASPTVTATTTLASNLLASRTAATLALTSSVADAGTAVKIAADTDLTSGTILTIGDNNGTSYSAKVTVDYAGTTTAPVVVGSTSVNTDLVKSNTAATIAVTSTVADAGTAIKLAADTDLTSGTIVTIGDNNGTSYAAKATVGFDGGISTPGVASGDVALQVPTGAKICLAASGQAPVVGGANGSGTGGDTSSITFTGQANINGLTYLNNSNGIFSNQPVNFNPGLAANDAKLTAGTGTVAMNGYVRHGLYKVTVGFASFTEAATSQVITIATLPAKYKVVGVICDTTQAYALAADTFTLKVGRAGDDDGFVVSHDVSTAAVTKGLADGDLGTDINRASAIQGGYIGSWTGTTAITITLTSSATNLGNGSVTALTAGSGTYYILTESLA